MYACIYKTKDKVAFLVLFYFIYIYIYKCIYLYIYMNISNILYKLSSTVCSGLNENGKSLAGVALLEEESH